MTEPYENPYAAPSFPADAPPVKHLQPISLINRIVSVAFITFGTFLLLGLISGLLLEFFAPKRLRIEGGLSYSVILAYAIVISGLYGFGFWLRRPTK